MVNATQIKIRYFVWLGYLIPIGLSIVSALGTWQQGRIVQQNAQELGRSLQVGELISGISFNIQVTSWATRGYMLNPDPASAQAFVDANQEIAVHIEKLQELIRNAEQKETLGEIERTFNQLNQINQGLVSLVQQGKTAEAINRWKTEGGSAEAGALSDLLKTFQDTQTEINTTNEENLNAALVRLTYLVVFLTIVSSIVALSFGWWIIGWISKRLNESITSLAASSNEIVTTVEEQERIASQQAASVNETSTTMEELGISSRQSSEQAQAAAQAAQQVLHLAESGRQTVTETIGGMDLLRDKVRAIAEEIIRLNEQTNQIGSISQLVSDLANQTNMLALNAAVEAVRAGEHGKGFSVVASEIRKLADQSRQSAGQISTLVGNIQQAIQATVAATDEGTQTVASNMVMTQRSADAFSGVTSAINEVVENNQQISLNIQQQASAIQQVVTAMTNLNQAAKESAVGIGQTRLSTQMLNDVAQDLQNLF